MKPHKHAELIKAWADGAEIWQSRLYEDGTQSPWESFTGVWLDNWSYRIKPEPKPDVVVETWIQQGHGKEIAIFYNSTPKNIRFTFNYYTGELKSAEVMQ